LLDDQAKSCFHARYAKIFRDQDNFQLVPGDWTVHFIGRKIRLPLRTLWSWLDWDCAVSVIGHEIEIKQTYAELVESDERPALFLDVGANYGINSVLFLLAGIPTIAFEPNRNCFSYFQAVCELNGLEGRWEQVAIGNKSGQIELVYPEKETWLGSVCSDVVSKLKNLTNVIREQVPLKMLDDFIGDIPRDKILVKIDVEGFEWQVIQGASQILRDFKPKIIFESNDPKSRRGLFQTLVDYGYSVHSLPWRQSAASLALRPDEFLTSAATNFIAIAH
jgi:FkbM family methyltransferase